MTDVFTHFSHISDQAIVVINNDNSIIWEKVKHW